MKLEDLLEAERLRPTGPTPSLEEEIQEEAIQLMACIVRDAETIRLLQSGEIDFFEMPLRVLEDRLAYYVSEYKVLTGEEPGHGRKTTSSGPSRIPSNGGKET